MAYKILNWDKYQARTDRQSSPWVKLWKDLKESADFYSVPERRRWEWSILLLMSKNHDGIIHGSDADIGFVLYKIINRKFDPAPFLGRLISRLEQEQDKEEDKEQEQEQELGSTGSQVVTSGNHWLPPIGFMEFWKSYPGRRKKNRPKCLEIWNKQGLEPIWELEIRAGLEHCKASADWAKNDGEYIPAPEVWLKRDGWHDEMAPAKKPIGYSSNSTGEEDFANAKRY